jgi:hypothetical protein
MKRLLSIVLAIALPAVAIAQSAPSYQCTSGGTTRRVEVVRTGAGQVPCEVRYSKPTEAPGAAAQVIYNAANQAGYCESRAAEFVDKLRGLGWTCTGPAAAVNGVRFERDTQVG